MPIATLTIKGQITIPKEIRTRLRLRAGQRLDFRLMNSGEVMIKPVTNDVRRLKGLIRTSRRPASLAEIRRAIESAFAGR